MASSQRSKAKNYFGDNIFPGSTLFWYDPQPSAIVSVLATKIKFYPCTASGNRGNHAATTLAQQGGQDYDCTLRKNRKIDLSTLVAPSLN